MIEATPGRAFVIGLLTGINHERAARLAAEARVKVLEKLLDDLDMYLDGPVPWNGDGRLIAEIIRKCRAALKEPAND